MKYFKFLILLLPLFTIACNQEPAGKKAAASSPFEQQAKTPLEAQINKITNTVLIEPLRALQDDSHFYREKHYLVAALDNSTQKDIFFSCDEFKKSLLQLLQTDYSTDFISGSCYALDGNLQKISNFIFIATPDSVDISGDFQELFDTPDNSFDVGGFKSPIL